MAYKSKRGWKQILNKRKDETSLLHYDYNLDREKEWDKIEEERLQEIASRDYTNSKVCKNWDDLRGLENDEWLIEIEDYNGWVKRKNRTDEMKYSETSHYLSTHTFYELSHKDYEGILRKCGFDVQLISWDSQGI